MIAEVKNLNFSYSQEENVLKDVSFSLEEGKSYAIVGQNGSGKSTLAKLLLGLLKPNDHSIFIMGKELNDENVNEIRRHVGIVFQNPDNQFIGSTVRDDIAFGLENRCVPTNQMDEIISKYATKVGMADYLDKEPENLSGGQKQRVAIAGVLAMNPEIVIFDEATAMLDPKGKVEIKQTINMMREENPKLTIISITHDVEEAFDSDEVIILNKGQIFYKGSPEQLLKRNEELLQIGLDIPFKAKLMNELCKRGYEFSSKISVEEIINNLCK